ncbi:MAG TPA: enoyl-CoA hydratase/isomerase family protein [Myxococcota bacterium]|nr:enoyl-CoA hydratase/isomerase family protein [Myxococcota bacterium]
MIELTRDGDVHVLHMRAGENRFDRGFLDALDAALDEVEASEGPAALVTTGEGKFYSNGLDLAWLGGDGKDQAEAFLADVHRMFARLLAFGVPTVAALNGHAFAGGGMMALAHDFRVMRADRGFFCLPESDLGLPLTPGMNAVVTAKLPKLTAHEAIVTGGRYGGEASVAKGIVHEAAPESEVLARAIERVRPLAGKDRATQRALKRRLYEAELAILEG